MPQVSFPNLGRELITTTIRPRIHTDGTYRQARHRMYIDSMSRKTQNVHRQHMQ